MVACGGVVAGELVDCHFIFFILLVVLLGHGTARQKIFIRIKGLIYKAFRRLCVSGDTYYLTLLSRGTSSYASSSLRSSSLPPPTGAALPLPPSITLSDGCDRRRSGRHGVDWRGATYALYMGSRE